MLPTPILAVEVRLHMPVADLVAEAEDAAVEPVGGGNRSTIVTVAGAPTWTPPTGTGIGMIRTPTWIGTPNGPGRRSGCTITLVRAW